MTNNQLTDKRLAQLAKRNFCQTKGEEYTPFGDEIVSMAAELQERRKADSEPVTQDEREAFEAFMAKRFGDLVDQRRAKNGDYGYMAWDMVVAWAVWQARAAMLQAGNCRENGNSSTNNFREIAETSTNYPATPDCWCRTCRPVVLNDMRFVVCPDCGNKRCPRANDHRNACSGSNDPGQEGSAYPSAPQEEKGE